MLVPVLVSPSCAKNPIEGDIVAGYGLIGSLHSMFENGAFILYNDLLFDDFKRLAKTDMKYGGRFFRLIQNVMSTRGYRVEHIPDIKIGKKLPLDELDPAKFIIVNLNEGEKFGMKEDEIHTDLGPNGEVVVVRYRGLSSSPVGKTLRSYSHLSVTDFEDREKIPFVYKWPIRWCKNIEIMDPFICQNIYDGELIESRTKSGLEAFLDALLEIRKGESVSNLSISCSFLTGYRADPKRDTKEASERAIKTVLKPFQGKNLWNSLEVNLVPKTRAFHDRFITFQRGVGAFTIKSDKGLTAFSNTENRGNTPRPGSIEMVLPPLENEGASSLNKHRELIQTLKLDERSVCLNRI